MAIQRTIKRKNIVRPVAVDMASGGLAMSQATQNIANTVSNVTQYIDENQFRDAVLKAEIAGRQLGTETITDKNGQKIPKPLDQMSLNSFTSDIYNKSNLEKAQQYFKKEAINSYGLALQNHAQEVANNSLLTNEGKIDQTGKLLVQSAGESYIDGIKSSVAPDVFSQISPSLSVIWGKANRKASAMQIKAVKAEALSQAEISLNNLLTYETNYITNGSADETDLIHIENNKEKIFKIIDENSPNKSHSEKAKLNYSQALQTNVSNNAVDLAYESGVSISELLKMAIDTGANFTNDPNIDGEKIRASMESRISYYDKLETRMRTETRFKSADLLATLGMKLLRGEVVSDEEISNLTLPDQHSLAKYQQSVQTGIDAKSFKKFNDNITANILDIEGGNIEPAKSDNAMDFGGPTQQMLKERAKVTKINEMVRLLSHKDLSIPNRSRVYNLLKKTQEASLALVGEEFKANMERMFGGSGGVVAMNPERLRSRAYVNQLKKRNIIGQGKGYAYTESEWLAKVNTYSKTWYKKQEETALLSQVGSKISNGMILNNKDREALEKILPTQFNLNGQMVNYDPLNANEDIRNISIDFYTRQITLHGYIPQKITDIFDSIKTLEGDKFTFAKQLYGTVKQAIINKYGDDGKSRFEFITSDAVSKVNTSLMDSAFVYDDSGSFSSANAPTSANRALSDLFPKTTLMGDTVNTSDMVVFDEAFKEVGDNVDDNWFMKLISNGVGGHPYETKTVEAFYKQSGVDNMAEAIIKDPFMKNEMIKHVKYLASQGRVSNDQKGLLQAVQKTLYKFTGNMHLHEDKNGNISLVRGQDIVRDAQSSVPGDGIIVTKKMIIDDAVRQWNNTFTGNTDDTALNEAIEEGEIMFISNNETAGSQTYRVVALVEDGRNVAIANNYQWNYHGSQLESDYNQALQKIQNGGVRKALGYFDFMSKSNINAVMESIRTGKSYADGVKALVASYNSFANTINSAPVSYTNILPYIESPAGQEELENFFDAFRLITRLDIR